MAVLRWLFRRPLVVFTHAPLSASVEGMGSGVGDLEHSVSVVNGIRSAKWWEELGFDFVTEVVTFVSVDVLGQWWEGYGSSKVDGRLLAKAHADREAKAKVLGRGEVPKQLEVGHESSTRFVRKYVVDARRASFFGAAVPAVESSVSVILFAREAGGDVGPSQTLGVMQGGGVVDVDVGVHANEVRRGADAGSGRESKAE